MFNNECIVYINYDKSYDILDMLYATYLRFYLEDIDQFSISIDDFKNLLPDSPNDKDQIIKDLIEDDILIYDEEDQNKILTNDNFLAHHDFISISVDVAKLFFTLNFKVSLILLIIYTFFMKKAKSRAYFQKEDNFCFSFKQICELLEIKYSQKNLDRVKIFLDDMQSVGLITYEKKRTKWGTCELTGLAYKHLDELLSAKEIKDRYYNG